MESVRELLNGVWSAFRTAGIADDVQIVGYIARLLTQRYRSLEQTASETDLSRQLDPHQIDQISRRLAKAADIAGGAGNLFDRHVVFRFPSMLAGGRYPTPRHLVQHMTTLANVLPTHDVADFACGTGGFLVHRGAVESAGMTKTWGIELSPEWAEIAQANSLLHDRSDVQVETGNALRIVGPSGELNGQRFDRILMNPPFGERVDPATVTQALNGEMTGARSETALIGLALAKLKDGGRAVMLAPSGLLFGSNAAERHLRKQLAEECHLEAIVALTDDGMQPFSQLKTYVLVVTKNQVADTATWFFAAEDDGYAAGRSRYLTEPPKPLNDLIVIENVICTTGSPAQADPWYTSNDLSVAKEKDAQGLTWLRIAASLNMTIAGCDLYPAGDNKPSFMLVTTHELDGSHQFRHFVPLGDGAPEKVEALEKFLRDYYNLAQKGPLPSRTVLHAGIPTRCMIVLPSGRLIGVAISLDEIRKQHLELRPDTYLRLPTETAPLKPPLEIIAAIQEGSDDLHRRLNRLVDYLEPTRRPGKPLVSFVVTGEDGAMIKPFGQLNQEQDRLWKQIADQSRSESGGTLRWTPKPFQPKDIEGVMDSTQVLPSTLTALDMFEKMGLIVPIHYPLPSIDNSTNYYRLTTERDVVPDMAAGPTESKK